MRTLAIAGLLAVSMDLGCSKPATQPVTITFLDIEYDTPDRLPGLAADLRAFTEETGIQIKRLPRPEGSLNQLAMWKELLQKGGPTPDLYGIDVIWSGILSKYLTDLKPYFGPELSSQSPEVVASYTVGDKLVGVPRHAYAGVLMYRPDLLRRYGYRDPPKTWDELEKMALRIQSGERSRGQKDFWGFLWQGGVSEDLTCSGLEFQASEGGGRIIEDDQTISINNPRAIEAWQRAARWVGWISPPTVVAYEKWDAENLWDAGKVAFVRAWVGDYSLINFHGPPRVATEFGVTSLPRGRSGRVDTLGGNGLAVSRTAAHSREAIELIRFLMRRDARMIDSAATTKIPDNLKLYEPPAIFESYGLRANHGETRGVIVARPSVVSGEKYEEVSRAYIRALHSVLTGENPAPVAAASLEKELIELTGFKAGPPK